MFGGTSRERWPSDFQLVFNRFPICQQTFGRSVAAATAAGT